MAFALQNRGARPGRHNWTDDISMLLKWIEENRVLGELALENLDNRFILVDGCLPLAQVNRRRRILGWSELEAEKPEAAE